MKAISCVNVGRFIHANRVPLGALLALAVIGGCSEGGATLVNPADIQGVSVNPTSVTVTVGGAAEPVAANVDAIDNAPATVTWTSSDPSVASVAPSGNSAMVTGMKAGTATITATSTANSAQHADASVRVVPGALTRIALTAGATQVAAYATLPVRAVALDAGGDTLASPTFTWSASNSSVATVDGNGVVTGVAPGTVNITATAGSVTSSALALTVVNPPVASISVTAPSSSMVMLSTMQATAVAMDASGHVLQGVAFSWASSNSSVATVSSSGVITALLTGTTSITASSGAATSNGFSVTVTAPIVSTITVTGPSSVTQHGTASLHATAYDAHGNALSGVAFTWTSSDPTVATVSTAGLVAGVALGLVTITAGSGSVTSNAFQVAVVSAPVASVTVTAGASTVTANQTLQAQAVAKDANGNVVTGQGFSWASSNPSVATVDGNGLVTGVAAGTVSITATAGSVRSNALALTVVSAPVATITVSAPSSSMGLLSTMQATAVARDASGNILQGVTFSWASSNTLVATVSSSGLISSLLVGSTAITASSGGVTSSAFSVTVTAPVVSTITVTGPSSVTQHGTASLHATAYDAHGNALSGVAFTWTSSDPTVVTVSTAGLVAGVALGLVTITAGSGSVTSNPFQVAVVNAPVASVTVTAGASTVTAYQTLQAQAVARDASGNVLTGQSFSWASSNPSVATVDGNGLVTGVAPGTVSITATAGSVKSNALALTVASAPVAAITVSGPSSSVTLHSILPLHATAVDAHGNALSGVTFTWASSNPQAATVSSSGQVSGVAPGQVTITATSGSVTSNAFQVTVVSAPVATVTVTAGASTVTAYQTLQAQAVARDASGNVVTGQSFSWTSSNPSVATVDGNGLVTGVARGTVSITATTGSVTSTALTLTVVNPPVATITVSAPSSSMGLLSTMQATAVAMDASGHVLQGVTFSWASSNTLVATVSNSGLISSLLVGTTQVTASSGGVTSNAITVTVGL